MQTQTILRFIHYCLAALWLYQGIVPKLLLTSQDEIAIWQFTGMNLEMAKLYSQISGVIEIIFGLLFIFYPHKYLHYLNILGMGALLTGVAIILPHTLIAAFNPVVMNLAMASLSIIALMLYTQDKTTDGQ